MAADPTTDVLAARLAAVHLNENQIADILKNKKLTPTWKNILDDGGVTPETDPSTIDTKVAVPLQTLVNETRGIATAQLVGRKYIVESILRGELKTPTQVEAAVKYVRSVGGDVVKEDFDKACGVGLEFTPEKVEQEVRKYVDANKDKIVEERYKIMGPTMSAIKKETILRFAGAGDVKNAVEKVFLEILGPKDERDTAPKKAPKAKADTGKAKADKKSDEAGSALDTTTMFTEGFLANLHKVGGNAQIKPELREQHLKATGGRVFTRFPPEPNGYLHIGHSKAIAINFGFAKYHGGECYLRYDDTNPEAEEERYFVAIREIVEWLGFKPYKITYSSDYFDQLYELAEEMIKRDKGYVCHCTPEEVFAQRGGENRGPRYACPHRNRPTEESLREFRAMRDGKYKPKEAMLRMKQDLEDGNPQMWDLTAYRILDASHHRTGDKWKIYPTYDFTHCLVDSFENITHSLCTTEFILSRVSYDWLCNALEVYRPQQNEYGRLNITGTLLSKRKIAKLVSGGYVRGWDDPRLFTLVAIRRRGVPPGAILSFVNSLGVTTATTNIQVARFETSVRRYLEETVPRLMMVLDPLPVTIENLPEDYHESITLPFSTKNPKMGDHTVPFTRTVYIDRSDFREEDSKDYFRLAPGKTVGLFKVPFPIRYVSHEKDSSGKVTRVIAHYENDVDFKKPKTYIQWVADSPKDKSPVKVEARLFNSLFLSEDPNTHPDGFLADVNPKSEEVYANAYIESGFEEVHRRAPWPEKEGESSKHCGLESTRFQALRVGYFALDSDSKPEEGKIVLNRIVTLKEDAGKNA